MQYNTEEQLSYINGFLNALEHLNTFADHNSTFYIERIERLSDYPTSLTRHLSGCTFEYNELPDWKTALNKTAKTFFISFYEHIDQLTENALNKSNGRELQSMLNIEILLEQFILLISQLITVDSKFFKVYVYCGKTWYESEYDDFLLDNGEELFYIHFGFSD